MKCLDRLVACLILDGSARRRSFLSMVGRSGFDLPLDSENTIITAWVAELKAVASKLESDFFPVRIIVDEITPTPQSHGSVNSLAMSSEVDPYAWRGSAGVLRDVTQQYAKDQFVLVIAGVQVPLVPLWDVVERMAQFDADIVLLSDEDGTSTDISLIRCGCLRDISPIGFVDFKEQALTQLSVKNIVRVLSLEAQSFMPVRSRESYIAALRAWSAKSRPSAEGGLGLPESYQPIFSITEAGAMISPDAEILDSVILSGAAVDEGACVVQSVVCPGQRIGKGEEIVRTIVGSDSLEMI